MTRAKDRHSRIARTLGCLVVSMTVGAALLDWVQPGATATAKPSIGLIAPLDTGSASWQTIRVVAHSSGNTAARQAHFVIDSDGRSSYTDCWKARKHLGPAGEIRIALLSPRQSNDVTPRQWSATQELVADLRQAFPTTAGRVVVDDGLALPQTARPARPRS